MAFSMTSAGNLSFANWEGSFLPAARTTLADQSIAAGTLTTTAVNTTIVGLQWARVKVNVKTFGTLAAADTFRCTLQVGTGAAVTGPENIASYNTTLETGDTKLVFVMIGSSIVGFQSWKLFFNVASSHTATVDILFDAA